MWKIRIKVAAFQRKQRPYIQILQWILWLISWGIYCRPIICTHCWMCFMPKTCNFQLIISQIKYTITPALARQGRYAHLLTAASTAVVHHELASVVVKESDESEGWMWLNLWRQQRRAHTLRNSYPLCFTSGNMSFSTGYILGLNLGRKSLCFEWFIEYEWQTNTFEY